MTSTATLSRICGFALLTGTLILAGCSRPVGSISGKVTYQNKPLKGGSITFVSNEGRKSVPATIGLDGTYKIDSIAAGTYKVCVDTSNLKPPTGGGPSGYKGGSGGKGFVPGGGNKPPPGKGGPPPDAVVPEGYKPSSPADGALAENAKRYMKIPDSYKDADKTDLSYTIAGGSQTFDIELK